jgi:hypothetical protein
LFGVILDADIQSQHCLTPCRICSRLFCISIRN